MGKDFKLNPGGGWPWDWAETGTRHSPGIQPADVEELLAHGADAVVLSQGMNDRLQVHLATRYLQQHSVGVHVAETRQAAKIYNDLVRPVSSTTPSPAANPQPSGSSASTTSRNATSQHRNQNQN